jgi:DNA helicase II / ATP-dependent DNA helicase PcrA
MAAHWLDELNPAQRRAATHPGGPVLVIAGAGTGKTKTLASRVAWLIERGVSPDRILLLTFTRRAAAEMLGRAARLTGQGTAGQVWGGTFHATSNRLLRQYGRALGLAPDFTVIDQADAADLMNLIRGDLRLGEAKRRFPQKQTLAAIYSRSVNGRTKLGEVIQRYFPWCADELDGIRQIFEAYTKRKRDGNVLDYDDLLLYWHALCTAPGVGETVGGRFDHLLVDEYQDTNLIQAEILLGMRREQRDLMVVGDDAQSIYSFRAATVRNILDFPQQFPGTEVVTLEENYRSVQPILDASNAVMAGAKERYTKNLYTGRGGGEKPLIVTCLDEAEQCGEVCDRVLAKREEGVELREQVVLFRAGYLSDQLEVELNRRNIPFVKYGGLKFVEAAHVKDMLAMLRILENPADELSWYRILQLFQGIGPASARRIIEGLLPPIESRGDAPETLAGPLHRLIYQPPAVPPAAKEEFASLREAVAACLGVLLPEAGLGTSSARAEPSPAAQVERIRRFYEPVFQRVYDNPTVRLRDLDQLEQVAAGYSSRTQFITDLTLDPPTSTQDLAGPPLLDEDYLILSTIHSAKGGEWDVVHLIHVSDGIIPSDMATGSEEEIEEERRLLYVAMTRARNSLNLYFPLRYYDRGRGRTDRHSYAQLTRFIPKSGRGLFDRASARRPEQPNGAGEPSPAGAAPAIDRMLSDLWSG